MELFVIDAHVFIIATLGIGDKPPIKFVHPSTKRYKDVIILPCSIPVPYISGANIFLTASTVGALASALGGNDAMSEIIGGVADACGSLPLNPDSNYFLVS